MTTFMNLLKGKSILVTFRSVHNFKKKYENECNNTILNAFNDYWKQGYAFEITNRNNKKFTRETKAWLLDKFNKWCKYDLYKKKVDMHKYVRWI